MDWIHHMTRPSRWAVCLCAHNVDNGQVGTEEQPWAWAYLPIWMQTPSFLPTPFILLKLASKSKADSCLCFYHMRDGQNEPKRYVICLLWGGESSAESHAQIWGCWQSSGFSAACRLSFHHEPNGWMAAEFIRIFKWAQRSLFMRIWILGK